MFGKGKQKVKHRGPAQGMVEFALVLPVLLLVIIALFEFGRLIFIYSTVVTAAREAARYGSSSNWNAEVYNKYYQGQFRDCAGIRARAQIVDFFNVFEDTDILIQYDHGPASTGTGPIPGYPAPFATCPPPATTDFNYGYADRIIVQVSADFTPMMGILTLPTIQNGVLVLSVPSFTIRSVSARSLLGMIVLNTYLPSPDIDDRFLISIGQDPKFDIFEFSLRSNQ